MSLEYEAHSLAMQYLLTKSSYLPELILCLAFSVGVITKSMVPRALQYCLGSLLGKLS